MNKSNHLSHRILKLTENGNGMTETGNQKLRRGRGMGMTQWLAVHIEGMKRWFFGTLALGSRNSLGNRVCGCGVRAGRWLSRVVWWYVVRLFDWG